MVREIPNKLILSDKLWRVILKPNTETNLYFLYVLLNTNKIRKEISLRASGTSGSMKNVSQEDFLDIKIKLPPKAEQDLFYQKVLLFWKNIFDNQTNSNSKLDNLFQSLLSQAFTGELTATWRKTC
ncbi:MAG: restriction endonuclease subunit S [Blastocatellia bacterium]|nr:restriction endonuclease subunit S [Blastocatellia bacterium]